jgi:hypothetical protein
MTFFHVQKPKPDPEFKLPTEYSKIPYTWRHKVRAMYEREQKGLCMYCNCELNKPAPDFITAQSINWNLFPTNFMESPIHLHHDHDTDKTIGVIHNYCNAVLWQYEGK